MTRLTMAGCLVCMIALFCVTSGLAQTTQGQLNGRVTDISGAVIPGAQISTTNLATGVQLQTVANEAGQYVIYLPAASYDMRVSSPGFAPQVISGVLISTATATTINAELQVEAVAEEVQVSATLATLETSDTSVGVNVEEKLLRDVPVPVAGNKRRPYQYIALSPTVNTNGFNQIAGSRVNTNVILLDGLGTDIGNQGFGEDAANNEPTVEAIGEYKILLNATAAEYGRTSGAVLTYATKSGSNEFHGSAWNYHNNSVLKARPWSAADRGNSRSNEFGVATGGPVVLPGYSGRNRTFFWTTWNAYRQGATGAPGGLQTVPTSAMRQGDFSAIGNLLYDVKDRFNDPDGTVRRRPFQNSMIPMSRLSQVTANVMSLLPLPNRGDDPELNYVGQSTGTYKPWDVTVKIDHNFNVEHRISGFYQRGIQPRLSTDRVLGPEFGETNFNTINRMRLDYTWMIKPSLINTFLFGMNKNSFGRERANFGQDIGRQFGILGMPDPNCPEILLNRAGRGQVDICGRAPAQTDNNTITNLSNTMLWNKGNHTIKFGYQMQNWRADRTDLGGVSGGITVSAAGTYFFNRGGNTRDTNGQGGFHLADFFLGLPTFVGTVSALELREREQYHGFFVQDDWKVTPKLTLNLGLRWDINVPFSEESSQYTGLDPLLPNPGASGQPGALIYYGEGPGRNGIHRPGVINYNDFGPRLGLAYQIDDKTVFRGFAGVLQIGVTNGNARFINRTGHAASGSPLPNPDPFGVYFEWDNPFPSDVLGEIPNTDPAFRNNQNFQNWMKGTEIGKSTELYNISAGFQRQVGRDLVLETTFFANLMRHGSDHDPVNQLHPDYFHLGPLLNLPITHPDVAAAGFSKPYPEFPDNLTLSRALRPFPQFAGVTNDASIRTKANYHAVMFKAQKRYSNGLSFLAHWTISKHLGDTDWRPGAFGSWPRHQYNRKLDKSVERFDTPQRLVISYSYELPFGPEKKWGGRSGASKYLLGGWSVAGVHEYMSGYPVAMGGGLSVSLPGGPGARPNRVQGVPIRSNISCSDLEFGNPQRNFLLNAGNPGQAARTGRPLPFEPEGAYQVGNAPIRDQSARQCGNLNENFSLLKVIPVTERIQIRIGADCFNCFNRHRFITFKFGQSNSGTSFGEIQPDQPFGPRVIQLRARVQW